MEGLELVFVIIGAVGFVFLLASLVFGELGEFIGEVGSGEIDSGSGMELSEPGWHDLKVIAAGLVGLGAFGFIALQLDWSASIAVICATFGFFGVAAGAFFGLLRPLSKQQSNTLTSRQTYVGRSAQVVVSVSPEDFGLVELVDDNGARVRQMARSDSELLPAGSRVLVFQVDGDCVRVMADPENPIELQQLEEG